MKSINLIFAIHNHQPIGNFDSVFEEVYQRSYKPFIDVLERHPSVKLTQHWTGPLLEWLGEHHPELIARMRKMVRRGQLEVLTGAYYEAILAVIPESDRVGQIRKLTDTVKRTFDFDAQGMWLAERVWEQPVAASLAAAGVRFVLVDDTHFKHVGLRDDQLRGYYITEEQGRTVAVIPIDKTLRYTVPFRDLSETLRYLEHIASEDSQRVVVHADDGEKFGIWPKTYKHVYEDKWLESFCQMLEEHQSWIRTVHMGTLLDTIPPLGRVYLPTASYSEMMKWSLDASAFLRLERFEDDLKQRHQFDENADFVGAGFWRNFLAKYPEANHMHKKMLRVSRRAHQLAKKQRLPGEIFDHIWASQCNDPYWHGVFGGLYLPNLRYPVYHHLLQAEVALDGLSSHPLLRVEKIDFDSDGNDELILESDRIDLCFTPASGGSLVELDYKPAALNLLDIVSRREEGYHRRLRAGDEYRHEATIYEGVIVKEVGLEQHLHFDWYRHGSLIDHFFADGTTLDAVSRCEYQELGDFVNQPYDASIEVIGPVATVTLERGGALWFSGRPHRVSVRKVIRYSAGADDFYVDYSLVNLEDSAIDVWFGVECCVGLMAGDAHDRYYDIEERQLSDRRLGSRGEEDGVRKFRCVDEWLKVETTFEVDRAAQLWRFPIETVSLSESGFERLYQCSVLIPHWKLHLAAGGNNDTAVNIRLRQSVRHLH